MTFLLFFAGCKAVSTAYERGKTPGKTVWRSRPRGSILALTLLVTVVLFILGYAYLSLLERDNRFAAVQERSERAWALAQSGLEYYRVYGDTSLHLSPSSKAFDPPLVLARVYVPESSTSHYFELADMGQGHLMSQGVVENTLPSGGNQAIRRTIVVPGLKMEDAYDISLSLK